MPSNRCRALTLMLLAGLLLPATAAAQDASAPDAPPPLWWIRNAHTLPPVKDRLLVHAEGQYGFSRLRGNMHGSQHSGGLLLVLRHNLISSGTGASIQKQNLRIPAVGGAIDQEAISLDQNLRYDLHRVVAPQVGVIYSRDDARFIDERSVWYGGVNLHPVNNMRVQSRILLAAGHQSESYTVPEPASDAAHGYVGSELHYSLSPQVRLFEISSVLFELGDTDNHYWNLLAGIDISVNRWLGIALNHTVTYDNQPVPSIALKRDAQQSIMLRVMY